MANNNRADRKTKTVDNTKRGNVKQAPKTREVLAKELKLKPKTKAFVDKLIDEPKKSNTQAYIETHETNDRKSASVSAARLLAKPSVQIYKNSAVIKAKKRVVALVDSENENIALKASQDIIDRVEGKAVQKNESTQRTVNVMLDLTGVKLGGHNLSPSQVQELTS